MLGFVPVPKPVCGATFEDLDGTTHTCHRAAPYWTPWHIHRNDKIWSFSVPGGWIFYFPLKAQRKANLATLTEVRRALEWNDDPGQYEALNTAAAVAEKNVPFGRWRGWKYEART